MGAPSTEKEEKEMEYDIHSELNTVIAVSPEALAADTDGASIDTEGFEGLEYVVSVGTAFVGGGFDITLEESDTGAFGGEETAVPAANIVGGLSDSIAIQVVITDADTTFRVGSVGKLRFQRCVLTETGTISAGVIGVTAVLGRPYFKPVADQNIT